MVPYSKGVLKRKIRFSVKIDRQFRKSLHRDPLNSTISFLFKVVQSIHSCRTHQVPSAGFGTGGESSGFFKAATGPQNKRQ